jgi:hypothetical protein
MRHETTRSVHALWDGLRGHRVAPQRMDITPGLFSEFLPDVFLLDDAEASFRFRLSGSRLTEQFGKSLTGMPFIDTFSPLDEDLIHSILSTITEGVNGVVCSLRFAGWDEDEADTQTRFGEMLLLPLCHEGRFNRRILGAVGTFRAEGRAPANARSVHIMSHRILSRAVKPLGTPPLRTRIADCPIILRKGPLCLLDTGKRLENVSGM